MINKRNATNYVLYSMLMALSVLLLTSCNNLYGFPTMEELKDSSAAYHKLELNESNYITPSAEKSNNYKRNIEKAKEAVVSALNLRYPEHNFAVAGDSGYNEILLSTAKYPFEHVTSIYREYEDETYSVLENFDLMNEYKDDVNEFNQELIDNVYSNAKVYTFVRTRAKILTNIERNLSNLNKSNVYVHIVLIPESYNDTSKMNSSLSELKDLCIDADTASYFKLYYLIDKEFDKYKDSGFTLNHLERQYINNTLELRYYTFMNTLKIEYDFDNEKLKYNVIGGWKPSPYGISGD